MAKQSSVYKLIL